MRNVWIAVGVILIAGTILWFVSKPRVSSAPLTQDNQAPQETATPSLLPTSSREILINGSEFSFDPATINVTKGDKIKITFKNTGQYPHNLVISDLNIATKTIQPNQTDTVEFIADKDGTFNMVCTVDAHEQKGMKGTLSVQ